METASEGIPLLSGDSGDTIQMVRYTILEILMQYFLTCLAPSNSLPKDQAKIYSAIKYVDLILVGFNNLSWQHGNHLIIKKDVTHLQIKVAMVSHLKTV